MADSLAGLVYGINVRTCDLIAAGKAFAQVHPALIALHHIQRLRDKCTIRVEAGKPDGVERVPVEVWTMIEQSVIDCGVENGRVEVVKSTVCEMCDEVQAESEAQSLSMSGIVKTKSAMLVGHFMLESKRMRDDRLATRKWADEWIDWCLASDDCDNGFSRGSWIQSGAQEGLERTVGGGSV